MQSNVNSKKVLAFPALGLSQYLEYSYCCPQERIKIFPIRGSKLILELTSKQIHSQDTEQENCKY